MIIDIIGAGLGGLTTAIALQQKGISTRIYEQAKEIKPVGAGIILANNAMQVYERLGLRDEIEISCNPISTINITDQDLSPISSIDLSCFESKYGVQNVAIHRGKLQEILISRLEPSSIRLDSQLVDIVAKEGGLISEFANGSSITSKILIGADGLHSTVRNSLFPKSVIRNASQLCWRGLADFALPKKYQNELNEAWGGGDRFGFVQIAPNVVYWYALKTNKGSSEDYPIDALGQYFEKYTSLIGEIIRATPVDNIHSADITDLKPISKWYMGNVCLLGDAAHATTPNMGQGACQAIEDGYVLSECLAKHKPNKAFAEFQRIRMPKAKHVVNSSWRLGKVSHWENPLAISFRNAMMRMAPKGASIKQSEKIFQL